MKHAKLFVPPMIIVLLLGLFLMGGGANVQAASGTWNVVPSPNPSTTENTLLGVAALGAKNVWAVG